MIGLNESERELLDAAVEVLRRNFRRGRHHVGAALRSKSGHIFRGIHIDSPAIDICAEAVAIGTAACEGESEFDCIVAVALDQEGKVNVIPPCGLCRELLSHLAPNIIVLLAQDGYVLRKTARELLPMPYRDFYSPP